MLSYTPGPWRVDTTKALGAYFVWAGHDYGDQICALNLATNRDIRNANADLIAAAPALLDTCKQMLDVIGKHYPNDWQGIQNAATVAIAAAEGNHRIPALSEAEGKQ